MDAYIILNKGYSSSSIPMFVERIAVSSSVFNYNCIHTDEKLYSFYSEDSDYMVLFVKNNSEYFIRIIEELYFKKDNLEKECSEIIRTLNKLNKHYD